MDTRISFPAARLRPALAAFALTGMLIGATAAGGTPNAVPIAQPVVSADGVIRIQSAHSVDETVSRVKTAVMTKGVRLFDVIDQAKLGSDAGLPVQKSTLVLFGNPPLGVQFLQANRYAGLDWPVRMLVVEESDGSVWLAWTDFNAIAARYRITNRVAQFKMASEVAASIAAAAAK